MAHLYALINSTGIHRLEMNQRMTLADMKNYVGQEGETDALIEFVCQQFSDSKIDLICDEEFLYKNLPLTCMTQKGIVLHGQVIAAAVRGADTVALTEQQFQIVQRELALALRIEPDLN